MSLGNALREDRVDDCRSECQGAEAQGGDACVPLGTQVCGPDDSDATRVFSAWRCGCKTRYDEAKKDYLQKAIASDAKERPNVLRASGSSTTRMKKQADAETALSKAVQLTIRTSRCSGTRYGECFRLHRSATTTRSSAYRKAVGIDPPWPQGLHQARPYNVRRAQAVRRRRDRVMTQSDPPRAKEPRELPPARRGLRLAEARAKLAIDAYEKFLALAPKDDEDRGRVKRGDQRAQAAEMTSPWGVPPRRKARLSARFEELAGLGDHPL